MGEPDGSWDLEEQESYDQSEGGGPSSPARGPAEGRLIRLMEEFLERQRERPELVVRPWWSSDGAGAPGGLTGRRGAVGFVVEYCPRGVESAELAVRPGRLRVEGPKGVRESSLELAEGWRLDGIDVGCPELLVNHMLAVADRLLGEAA